jgi:hypothetical protein
MGKFIENPLEIVTRKRLENVNYGGFLGTFIWWKVSFGWWEINN